MTQTLMKKPVMRVLHHMARTGGTLISRCLASMDKVILLSEVNPQGLDTFCPRNQAREWFQLLHEDEARRQHADPRREFLDALVIIAERCDRQGSTLVVRDWSHLDFTGLPFISKPTYRLTTSVTLGEAFDVLHTATVRHPLEQLLSLRAIDVVKPWDEDQILHGMRLFAEKARSIGFVRYEDFCREPNRRLRELCDKLHVNFDPQYQQRWRSYDKITGDMSNSRVIEPRPLPQVDPALLERLGSNADYQAILQILGYEHPRPPSPNYLTASKAISAELDLDEAFNKANQFTNEKRFEQAVPIYQQIVAAKPSHTLALNNLGYCLHKLDLNDWAVVELNRALNQDPTFALAMSNMILALKGSKRRFESIPYRRRLTELEPKNAEHCFFIAEDLIAVGRIDECLHYLRRALQLRPLYFEAAANYLMYLHYSDRETPDSIAAEHFRLSQYWKRKSQQLQPKERRRHARPLRIGYLAADFYTHPVGKLMQPIIEQHDKSKFAIYCYHHGSQHDDWTARTSKVATKFSKVHELSSAEIYQQIQDDEIDILVDLGGFTGGGNRLELFAQRAAPIQVAFLGYPDTSGLAEIDYRISDAFCDPPGLTEDWHSEKLIRLSKGFLCYAPPQNLPPLSPPPRRKNGYLTFGCFNNIAKISPLAIRTWAEIVHRVPNSVMAFKYGDRYESSWIQEHIRSIFASEGVDSRRLQFWKSRPSLSSHLEAIGSVDIALDSFPYQGTMTTLETLTMSVPIITLEGETYCRRASSSLLRRLWLDDLVTDSPQEYAQAAVDLAAAPELLEGLREQQREQFFESEICDVAGFTRELEASFADMYSKCDQ
jgi:protein O-GlcNAc transferase